MAKTLSISAPWSTSVRNFVLPFDVHGVSEAAPVKRIELFGMPTVHCACFTGVQ